MSITQYLHSKPFQKFLEWTRKPEVTPKVAAAAATVVVLGLVWRSATSSVSSSKSYFGNIPTPKGCFPLLGHFPTIGSAVQKKFSEWQEQLGPIFRIKAGSQDWLVIGDPQIAYEILVTKGQVTSDRPKDRFMFDINCKGGKGIVFTHPDKSWRSNRTSLLNILGPRKTKEIYPVLCEEGDDFVNIVSSGENLFPLSHLLRVSLNFILLTVCGFRTTSIDDPVYKNVIKTINNNVRYSDFKYAIGTYVPALRFVDRIIGGEKKFLEFIRTQRDPILNLLVKKGLEAKEKNVVKELQESVDKGEIDIDDMRITTIDLIVAGTETTAVTMSWAFLQLSTKPEIQKKIQDEIDAFYDEHGRLPMFWEREAVPYMIAVQRECFRMRPSTDFGLPHTNNEEFEWRGNIIPKNTLILTNMMTMHRDPHVYPEPDKFLPERFLGNTDTLTASTNRNIESRDQYNFGWGRRVCAGAHLAEIQFFNIWVRLLHKCNIRPALDANGNGIPVSLETVPALAGPLVVSPSHFEIRFVPRH